MTCLPLVANTKVRLSMAQCYIYLSLTPSHLVSPHSRPPCSLFLLLMDGEPGRAQSLTHCAHLFTWTRVWLPYYMFTLTPGHATGRTAGSHGRSPQMALTERFQERPSRRDFRKGPHEKPSRKGFRKTHTRGFQERPSQRDLTKGCHRKISSTCLWKRSYRKVAKIEKNVKGSRGWISRRGLTEGSQLSVSRKSHAGLMSHQHQ